MIRSLLLALSVAFAGALPSSAQARVGSIYNPDAGPNGYIIDKTARRPGDLLTVIISETQGVANTETSTLAREDSFDAALTAFQIKPDAFTTLPTVSGSMGDDFTGTANYQKSGRFDARVTVIVIDVLPTGDLVVKGRREIRIDREKKVIDFSGIVRRYDVRPDNTVPSELVANANVSYLGEGPLTRTTNRSSFGSMIRDFFAWIWPF